MRPLIGLLLLAVMPGFATETERSLPLFFFRNSGLTDSSVRYIVESPDLRAAFRADSVIFQKNRGQVQLHFAGANPNVIVEGVDVMPGQANFFTGQDTQDWKTGLATYHKILYRGLYAGIDMTYGGTSNRVKSEFLLAPGADPSQIRLEYTGIDSLSIDANGDLVIRGNGMEMREDAPTIYQAMSVADAAGQTEQKQAQQMRIGVNGRYRLIGPRTVGFELDSYDRSRTLVIDPVISYCSYLGGSSLSSIMATALDSSANLYVTGWTESMDFQIAGAVQVANQGGVDAFIAKFNSTGTALLYATYIGGRGDDRGAAIAVDSSGQAYVTGSTASTNFPLAAPIRLALGGSKTAFALKLSSVGNTLLYSTYLGGTNYDLGTAIAVNSSGNAYIGGDTMSTNFPVLGAFQSTFGGQTDGFVTKLTSAGVISFSSFLGGSGNDHVGGIALDSSKNIYVTGGTFSTNFPTKSPIQAANAGGQDAFVTKINAAGSSLAYSTYLGGNAGSAATPEVANGIAVDSSGNAYVTGATPSSNFPITVGSYQVAFDGVQDAFVTKVNAAGTAWSYSTYLGGTSFDWGGGIAVDSSGSAYVAGYTSSPDFPSLTGVQTGFNGMYDAFVSKLNGAGNALAFSTYLGGTGSDFANAISIDASGNMFVAGQTTSRDLPLHTPVQSNNIGGSVGWVARLGVTAPPPQVPSVISVSPASGSGNTVTLTAQYSDPAGASALTAVSLLLNTTASTSYACYVTYTASTGMFTLANDDPSTGSTTVIPGGGNGQNDQCVLNGAASSVSLSGTTLTLTASLTFQPAFPGAKSVYLYASDANTNTGWVAKGAWTVTVPAPQPSADSVSPNGSTGVSQTFTFVFSDTQSALNLTGMAMMFSASGSAQGACYIVYDANQGRVSLLWDSALGSDSKPLASPILLQNSQCVVGVASSGATGLSNIVTLAVTFKPSFSGLKNIYMYAAEANSNTGWVIKGTYNIVAGGLPTADSVVPASGSGPAQRYSFTVSDQGGSGYLTGLAVLIASSFNMANACSLVYDRTTNTISLGYDNPANGAGPLTPGSHTVVSNSQCALNGANTTVAIGVNSIVVTMDLTFSASWFGAKNVYLYASEVGVNSGWITRGTWTVTGGAPTADSVTPSSGSGSSPTFVFSGSDSSAGTNITGMLMLITTGSPTNTTNACYLNYNRNTGTIGLYDNSGTVLSTKPIGSSASLQNSQCAVGYSVMNTSGNSVLLSVNVVFNTPSFDGAKTVYFQANEPNTSSGWVSRGAWTVQ